MDRHSTPRTVTAGPWLAIFLALAVVVGVVALACAVLVRAAPGSPQDALARIPVSTATPYPYATTATPWKTTTATPSDHLPTTTSTQFPTTVEPEAVPPSSARATTRSPARTAPPPSSGTPQPQHVSRP